MTMTFFEARVRSRGPSWVPRPLSEQAGRLAAASAARPRNSRRCIRPQVSLVVAFTRHLHLKGEVHRQQPFPRGLEICDGLHFGMTCDPWLLAPSEKLRNGVLDQIGNEVPLDRRGGFAETKRRRRGVSLAQVSAEGSNPIVSPEGHDGIQVSDKECRAQVRLLKVVSDGEEGGQRPSNSVRVDRDWWGSARWNVLLGP